MEKQEQMDFQHQALRNATSWMLSIIAVPRAIARDESRWVQFVCLPLSAQHSFTTWAEQHHPDLLEAWRDEDKNLRTIPEPSYHAWIANLMGVEP